MRIIVNHLTRMQPGFVCAAGIDVRSGRHVRPVLSSGRIVADLARSNGGLLTIGGLLDLGEAYPVGTPPQLEDHLVDPWQWRVVVDQMQPDKFWQALESVAQPSLCEIFGPELRFEGHSAVVDLQHGSASLGCLRFDGPLELATRSNHVRARFEVDGCRLDLSLTDLRMYDSSYAPHTRRVAELARHLNQGRPTILAVGLTRAFKKSSDDVAYHWLQVNNVFVRDNPYLSDAGHGHE